ncbi:hypothetical protein [Natronocalculus amylovorans]|uniref:Uncharacterized protein n=1 Tax=Natronocalculus amylovorans TaxID=2917812 RepID=A0AAE3K960_9EURY|nr:hypothetical protein [Natronocalculus amylovorans]MCL9815714.1 hypothetical protein [Natronocalculus amylovorans]NUE01774.1 hypothetical protein [Halorubraceae archaeon YAN]
MTETTTSGLTRLRGSGYGAIIAGVFLAVLSLLLPFVYAAAGILLIGLFGWITARQKNVPTTVAIGVIAIGAIGVVEALPGVGLGLSPLVLAGVAIAFGVFDIIAGTLLDRLPGRA